MLGWVARAPCAGGRALGRAPSRARAGAAVSLAVVAAALKKTDVGKLASSDQWALTEAEDHQRVWTDDYSNVLGAVWRRLRKGEE